MEVRLGSDHLCEFVSLDGVIDTPTRRSTRASSPRMREPNQRGHRTLPRYRAPEEVGVHSRAYWTGALGGEARELGRKLSLRAFGLATFRGLSYRRLKVSRGAFISYRRDDAASEAGRLADAIRMDFGDESVFLDTSDIRLGEPWPEAVGRRVEDAAVVVTVMGPEWILARDEWGRRRIDETGDWVRHEIRLALEHGKPLVPLLVRHARMPPADALPPDIAALSERQAFAMRTESWRHDVELVLRALEPQLGRRGAPQPAEAPSPAPPPVTADDFRAVALGFDSRDVGVRNETAEEIKDIAASLDLDEVLALCHSRKTAERVGAGIALGVHLRSSGEARRNRRALSALGELLADRSSLVRYRGAEVLRASPALVPTFEEELRRLAQTDANSYVRAMAERALRAARR
jgi:TIR domain